MLVLRQWKFAGGWLASLWLPHCVGFTCKVVRGSSALTPCLEHVRAGGRGECYKCTISCICMFGDYTLPLDHLVLVRSDI